MSAATELRKIIQKFYEGLTLADLLKRYPDVARRTAQRGISQLIENGQITGIGHGRARRYFASNASATAASSTSQDIFPSYIPLSADSRDIVAYINQPPSARKPVGYQRDFLDTYQPNVTSYLSADAATPTP